jgi:hypothetical protein
VDINQMAKITFNKNLSILKNISISGMILCASASLAYSATCSSAFTATGGSSCTFTPDSLTVSVYKFGLCQTKPTYADYGDCLFFLNADTATDVTVSQGTSFSLGGETTLDTGTYTYLVQLWDDTVSFNYTHEFTTSQTGADGVAGGYCYTNGNDKPNIPNTASLRNITCTTTAALAAASEASSAQEITNLGTQAYVTSQTSVSGTWDAYLLSNTTTLATVASATASSNGTTSTYYTSNGNYLFSVMTLSSPVTISEDTTYIDMAVLLDDAMTQEVYYTIPSTEITGTGTWCYNGIADGSGTYACLGNAELSTLGFTFTND